MKLKINNVESGTSDSKGWRTSFFAALLLATLPLHAQQPTILPPGAEQQIMVPQPAVEISPVENVSVTAEFDPPVAASGQKVFYRVNMTATENSIRWPDIIAAPPELQFGDSARGQLTQPDGTKAQPLTSFVYEVTPTAAGRFTVPSFTVKAGEKSVEVPATSLAVLPSGSAAPPAQRLLLEFSETNIFDGQPISVRVIAPANPGAPLAALRDVQFNGGGIFTDKLSARMSATAINLGGQMVQAFIYEATAFPLASGQRVISAQAFTVSLFSAGPISITSAGGPITLGGAQSVKAMLLKSEATGLNVRPLPADAELPGFTGAMGKFISDKAQLSTNRIHVGEPVVLRYAFTPGTNLVRFVAPQAPPSREWQIIPGKPGENVFTLIPLTDEATKTPVIPFCAFDFVAGKFYDLTIPAQPVSVLNDGLPVQVFGWDEKSPPLKLSGLAAAPGKSVANLKPQQLQGWNVFLALLPLYVLFRIWQWDERRRYLEAHPEIVRRMKARKDLRAEKIRLRQAVAAGDAEHFVRHAAAALRIAVAPHFPADDRALVGGDVLSQLDAAARGGTAGETVRKVFAAADAQFAGVKQPAADLLALNPALLAVLKDLGEKL